MSKIEINLLTSTRLIPVITINSVSHAAPLAEALINAGQTTVEVTLRTPESLSALAEMARFSELLIGVGSVKNATDLSNAVNAGAQFAISPGYSDAIADKATDLDITYVPGISTATEIMQALAHDLKVLKFFPAETSGGVKIVQALSAPFPGVTFIPTGGINATNALSYLAIKSVIAVGGSWMVTSKLLDEGNFNEITRLTREAITEFQSFGGNAQ